MSDILTKLTEVQSELKAPKSKTNNFGKYKYRSCEDILEAVKPLLYKRRLALVMNDDIVFIEGRFYVKATATIYDGDTQDIISSSAYAREAETKAGTDPAQLTGACSSYARKYALNALFAIDDTKDADTDENAIESKERAKADTKKTAKTTTAAAPETVAPVAPETKAPAKATTAKKPNPIRAEFVELCKANPEKVNFQDVCKMYKLNNSASDEDFNKALNYVKFLLKLNDSGLSEYPEEV